MTKLTLENIENLAVSQKTYKPDWDDVAIDFTFKNDITLSAMTVCCNLPVKNLSLEGIDGYVYIETLEDLQEFCEHSFEYHIEKIQCENPDFDLEDYV